MDSPFGISRGPQTQQQVNECVGQLVKKWPTSREVLVRKIQALLRMHLRPGDLQVSLLNFTFLCDYSSPYDLSAHDHAYLQEIIVLYGRCYAAMLPPTAKTVRVVDSILDVMKKEWPEARRPQPVTVIVKGLDVLAKSVRARCRAVEIARDMFPGEFPWGYAEEEVADARQQADLVAERIILYRHYGVKTCVMQDGLLEDPKDAWVFRDGLDQIDSGIATGVLRRPVLALSHLAERQDIKQLNLNSVNTNGNNWAQTDFNNKMAVAFQLDGTLTLDSEYGVVPLEEVFEEAGCKEAYELFRLTHLLRLSDLVLPLEVYRQLDVPERPVLPGSRKAREEHRRRAPQLLRRLVVPRLRIMQHPELIEAALQAEITQAEIDTDAAELASNGSITRPRVRHWVPGFKRPLPKGCVASPEAHVLAWRERKIVLPTDYTYVKGHDRGSLEDSSIGHEAIRRPRSM